MAIPSNIQEYRNAIEQGFRDSLQNRMSARLDQYIKAREYYDGVHRTQLTERIRQFLNIGADVEFNANYCQLVVNAKADRLKLSGFETTDNSAKLYWEWWKKNRMDKKQGIVHRAAIRDGDAYVLVEWDNLAKIPRFYYESAYAGDGVCVYYSDEKKDEIAYASKQWVIALGKDAGTLVRLNLYFPDRIEKYISKSDAASPNWQPFADDENTEVGKGALGQAAIHWWTEDGTSSGLPLGVPIVHFKENDNGDSYGISHLSNVMPLQDVVNKSLIDLIAAMDTDGLGTWVGYGTDWSNKQVGAGTITSINASRETASLERIEGANPVGLLSTYNALVMELARVSSTPLSYFQVSGQVAAEGTMKQQEIGLLAAVKKAQTDFGNSWEDVMGIARRLHNAFSGGAKLSEDTLIDAVWEEAEIRNEAEQATTLATKVEKLGVSKEQAQIEMGYDDSERAKMRNAALKEAAQSVINQSKIAAANQKTQGGMNNQAQAMQRNMTQTENENEMMT